jgi:hypothetical protein
MADIVREEEARSKEGGESVFLLLLSRAIFRLKTE